MTSPRASACFCQTYTNTSARTVQKADSLPGMVPRTVLDNVTLCSANAARIANFRPTARRPRISEAKIHIPLPLSTIAKSLHLKEKNTSPQAPPKALFPPSKSHPDEHNKHC